MILKDAYSKYIEKLELDVKCYKLSISDFETVYFEIYEKFTLFSNFLSFMYQYDFIDKDTFSVMCDKAFSDMRCYREKLFRYK